MAVVFVSKESAPGETRVAATPETTKQMIKAGLSVEVEASAGAASGFVDEDYKEAGASIVSADKRSAADMVLSIRPPSDEQIGQMKQGAVLICSLQPMLALPTVQKLAEAKISSFAMDLMPFVPFLKGLLKAVLPFAITCSENRPSSWLSKGTLRRLVRCGTWL